MSVVEKIKQEIIDVEKFLEEHKKEEQECEYNLEMICNPLVVQAYHRGVRDSKKDVLKILEDHRELGKYVDGLSTEMTAKIESDLKLHGISQNNELAIVDKKQGKFVVVEKQKLRELADLLKTLRETIDKMFIAWSWEKIEVCDLEQTESWLVETLNPDNAHQFYEALDLFVRSFGVYEKKFAELGLDTKKEKPSR